MAQREVERDDQLASGGVRSEARALLDPRREPALFWQPACANF